MRKLNVLIVSGSIIMLSACGHSDKTNQSNNNVLKKDSAGKQDNDHNKLVRALVKDTANTLNYMDANGKRQGHWIINNTTEHLPGYSDSAKVEEGDYQDNMKEGEWIEYNADGSVKSTTTFKDNKPVR